MSLAIATALLVVAGCASQVPRERSAGEPPPAAPARCSAGDPDRSAWFCVLGQMLYAVGSNFLPDTQHRP